MKKYIIILVLSVLATVIGGLILKKLSTMKKTKK